MCTTHGGYIIISFLVLEGMCGSNDARQSLVNRFAWQWSDNVKVHKYTKFDVNIPRGSRVMSIFTKRARPAKMMLDEASSPFCMAVAGQC